jgi:5-methylcytosine-specific restriction enzyme A
MPKRSPMHRPPTPKGRRHEPHRDEHQRQRKRFYDSAVWQRTREAKLRRDPFCQCCAVDGQVTKAVHVDHWVAIAQGGAPLADDNLVSLCLTCHSRKTMHERNGTKLPIIVSSRERQISIA